MDPVLRPTWMKVILETQEQFPVRRGDENAFSRRLNFPRTVVVLQRDTAKTKRVATIDGSRSRAYMDVGHAGNAGAVFSTTGYGKD
jgi:hypothetical protein